MRYCVVNRETGKTSRCFGTKTRARKWCARLNRLCRCRAFTIIARR